MKSSSSISSSFGVSSQLIRRPSNKNLNKIISFIVVQKEILKYLKSMLESIQSKGPLKPQLQILILTKALLRDPLKGNLSLMSTIKNSLARQPSKYPRYQFSRSSYLRKLTSQGNQPSLSSPSQLRGLTRKSTLTVLLLTYPKKLSGTPNIYVYLFTLENSQGRQSSQSNIL